MKRKALYIIAFIATLAFTGCHKHKDDMPSLNGVDGHITNIDGKDIHFASSTNNTAKTYGTNWLDLEFNDSKSQVKINLGINDISVGDKGNFTLHDSTSAVYIHISTNPSGQQSFETDPFSSDNGTVVISTFTKDHVVGELKQATLEGGGSSTITIHDCKFNLKVE